MLFLPSVRNGRTVEEQGMDPKLVNRRSRMKASALGAAAAAERACPQGIRIREWLCRAQSLFEA